jgi:hypothetical protein
MGIPNFFIKCAGSAGHQQPVKPFDALWQRKITSYPCICESFALADK